MCFIWSMQQLLTMTDRLLMEVAASVYAKENIDLAFLDARSQRSDLLLVLNLWQGLSFDRAFNHARRSRCGHCKDKFKLYTNSNKFGKLRRSILYQLLDMGILGPEAEKRKGHSTRSNLYWLFITSFSLIHLTKHDQRLKQYLISWNSPKWLSVSPLMFSFCYL